MSDTPRTDTTDLYDYQTAVDFSRSLERENTELRECLIAMLSNFGGVVTDGCLGKHTIRLMAWPDGERLAVVVDGQHRQARTLRGVIRCMANMVHEAQQTAGDGR